LLAVRGPDAVRFLNGQVTQDVAGLDDAFRAGCVTDAKGKLQFFVSLCRGRREDEIWVAARPGVAEALHGRFDRYLIADEVEMEDLSGTFQRIHADAELPGALLHRQGPGPFGLGWDHWFEPTHTPDHPYLADDQAESLRIRTGIPAWGSELFEGLLPPEAGLDRWAISYTKGCYIGQEVISRIKSVGRVNRRLARFEVTCREPGPLLAADTEVGELTSIDPLPDDPARTAALGYLRKKGYDHTEFTLADGEAARWLAWA
jgi:folate-binding protein YgfZ